MYVFDLNLSSYMFELYQWRLEKGWFVIINCTLYASVTNDITVKVLLIQTDTT